MAVDDLTITSQRSQVVDFSVPYQTSTLQILIKVRKIEKFEDNTRSREQQSKWPKMIKTTKKTKKQNEK